MGAIKRLIFGATLAGLGFSANAADYATCLLDRLPGVKNAPAHAAALPVHPSA